MLKELEIQNFRSLEDVKLKNLGRVNLIGGKNGSGKTSVLEALWLFASPTYPEAVIRLAGFRNLIGINASNVFRDIFYDFNDRRSIRIEGKTTASKFRRLGISLQERRGAADLSNNDSSSSEIPRLRELRYSYIAENGEEYATVGKLIRTDLQDPVSTFAQNQLAVTSEPQHELSLVPSYYLRPRNPEPLRDIARRYGELQQSGQERSVSDFVSLIDPRIEGLVPILVGDEVVMHADVDGRKTRLSVQLMGQGTERAVEIAVVIGSSKDGMVMIDEIENGLHHSALVDLFSHLQQLSERSNVQVFATTHSRECVKAAHDALGPIGENLSYHRIGERDGKPRAASYDDEMLRVSFELGLEIR